MRAFCPVIALPLAVVTVSLSGATAQAAMLSFSGRVHLFEPVTTVANRAAQPESVSAARVTVTFHGHEAGITEYTTSRTARTSTDQNGFFVVDIKMSEYRYRWTHVTIAVAATETSKETTLIATVYNDGQGGSWGTKDVFVMPAEDPIHLNALVDE